MTDTGTTIDEDKKVLEWCVDEAKGRIGISLLLRYYTLQANVEMAKHAERIGCDSLFLSYPITFRPRTVQEVHEYTRAICDSTNLACALFPSIKDDFPFPGRVIPPEMMNRIADIDNVIAMKIGVHEWQWVDRCFDLFGDKILICWPFDDLWPTFIRKYGMQWSGCAPWQVFQTPDDRREVDLFGLILEGKMEQALELYWKNDPIRKLFIHTAIQTANLGLYNYQSWKYCEGLVGMTGGDMRMPKLGFFEQDRHNFRQAMLASGLRIAP